MKRIAIATFATVLLSHVVTAQQPPAPPRPPAPAASAPAPLVPLRVEVTLSKYQGDKKISSTPYTLAVNANERDQNNFPKTADLTSAIQVLIPMVTVNEKTTGPVYKDVGTRIQCRAESLDGGRFKLELNVEDQRVLPDAKLPADGVRGPWLQAFRSNQSLILKDGQSSEYSAATEQVSGEQERISVLLTVVK